MVLEHAIPPVDPLAAFAAFCDQPMAMLLDSATGEQGGRYSYLAVDPFQVIKADDAGVTLDGQPVAGDPFTVLEQQLARYPLPTGLGAGRGAGRGPVPFRTGAVGFLGYELGRHLERLPTPRPARHGVPDLIIGLYDLIAAFDHTTGQAWIIASGFPETEPAARWARATARMRWLKNRLAATAPLAPTSGPTTGIWTPDLTPDQYRQRVERILAYIRAGDIFQANLTHGFSAHRPNTLTPFDLYRRLRCLSPAPFAACLNCGGGVWLAGASPERFLAVDSHGRVETRPIKGTRPRGATPEADRRLLAELVASTKDRAENLMITDLMRNDLGRACKIGSISVPSLIEPVSFACVHHLVSVIQGQLLPGCGPVDLLRATFPGGSITGAPKIRAMEIITELETERRGPYCGAVAWIGFDQTMDSCITIRTLTLADNTIIAQAGGGITAESDPEQEYQELLTKVGPLLAAAFGDQDFALAPPGA
ncbi:Aminodeoxychorismate synthase component 1 [uncultured Gammaproteobacteria bacterium]